MVPMAMVVGGLKRCNRMSPHIVIKSVWREVSSAAIVVQAGEEMMSVGCIAQSSTAARGGGRLLLLVMFYFHVVVLVQRSIAASERGLVVVNLAAKASCALLVLVERVRMVMRSRCYRVLLEVVQP